MYQTVEDIIEIVKKVINQEKNKKIHDFLSGINERVLFLFPIGPPMCGKGHWGKKIFEALLKEKRYFFSFGEHFRKHKNDYFSYTEKGELIPCSVVCNVFLESFQKGYGKGKRIFFFDGFLRTSKQVNFLYKILSYLHSANKLMSVAQIIDFNVDKEYCMSNFESRQQEEESRDDSNIDTMVKRIDNFMSSKQDISESLKEMSYLANICKIDFYKNQKDDNKREIVDKVLYDLKCSSISLLYNERVIQ